MRKIVSLVIIYLMISLSFIVAENQSIYVSALDNQAYEEFWKILNREAELIVQLNNTNDPNQIENLAQELIKNSQNGSQNAAQISALIWQSLEEIKNSGVKTYYTAEELRELAQNISQNGLPEETIQALKEQGWSDDEIKALEQYIIENSDQINEDFNLTKFLEDFSLAFIEVGFKYNYYETWALEKWKWSNAENASIPEGENIILPQLQGEWTNFYKAYYNGTLDEQLTTIQRLKDKIYGVISSSGSTYSSNGILILDGGTEKRSKIKNGVICYETYKVQYYWKALESYEKASQIKTLLLAKDFGNDNEELKLILNGKIAELKEALIAVKVSSMISYSCDSPIKPFPPIKPPSTFTTGENLEDPLTQEALDPNTGETVLYINGEIIANSITPDKASYKVQITVRAENAQATNINIYIDGNKEYGPFDLGAGESRAITLPVGSYFTEDIPSNAQEITLSKTIKVTYTKWCNNINSVPGGEEVLSAPAGCGEEAMVIKTVSKTIQLFDSQVSVSKAIVKVNEPVEFTFTITNYMTSDKTFNLLVTAGGKSKEDTLTVPAGETKTKTLQLTFNTPGERTYYAKVDGTTYAVGTIKVEDDDSSTDSGNLTIESVELYPNPPRVGDTAEFRVKVKNTYSSSKSFTLKLKVNGSEVYSESVSLNGGKSATFKLYWTPEKVGRYVWGVMVSVPWGTASYREGTVNVVPANAQFGVSLEAMPTEIVGGGTVVFTVKASNYLGNAYSLFGYVVDEDGAVIKRVSTTLPASAQDYTLTSFSLQVSGVGTHTYTLFLDNYDGEPNGIGEEHWDEVRVIVHPSNETELQQVAFECNDPEFNWNGIEYKAKLVCRAIIYNPTQNDVSINSVSVENWSIENQEFMESLESAWMIEYPAKVEPSQTAEIVFKNTAHTGLITLEKDLFGTYVGVSIEYIISPQNAEDITFTGFDVVNIKQDNSDVIVDVGTNAVLIGGEVKAIIVSAKLIRAGKVLKGLGELAPVIADFIRRAWSWR